MKLLQIILAIYNSALYCADAAGHELLSDNLCFQEEGFVLENTNTEQINIKSTGLISRLKSLIQLYKINTLLDQLEFPATNNICGDFQKIKDLGILFHPLYDSHFVTLESKVYLFDYFALRVNDTILFNFNRDIITSETAKEQLEQLTISAQVPVNMTIPYTNIFLAGSKIETIPLALYQRQFFFYNSSEPVCLFDMGYVSIKSLMVSNKIYIRDIILKIVNFIKLVTAMEISDIQTLNCNDPKLVMQLNAFPIHYPVLANIFWKDVKPDKKLVFQYEGDSCLLKDKLHLYIQFLTIINTDQTQHRHTRSIWDILGQGENIKKLISDTPKYNKIFHVVQSNEQKLVNNQEQLQSWMKNFQIAEENIILSLQSLKLKTNALLSDMFHFKLNEKLKLNYFYHLSNVKEAHLQMHIIGQEVNAILDKVFSQESNTCTYSDHISCTSGRPLFRVNKNDLYLVQHSYTLKTLKAFMFKCLPRDDGKVFRANNKMFLLDKSMYSQINGNLHFIKNCLDNRQLCDNFYEFQQPSMFLNCWHATSLELFFIKCRIPVEITLLDRTHILVKNETRTIPLFNFPITAANKTITVHDLNILNSDLLEDSYFSQHISLDPTSELTFIEISTTSESNIIIPQVNISEFDHKQLQDWLFPEKLSYKPFLGWGTVVLIIMILSCCCLACCSKTVRMALINIICCLPKCFKEYRHSKDDNSSWNTNTDANRDGQESHYTNPNNDTEFVNSNWDKIRSAIYATPELLQNLGKNPIKRYLSKKDLRVVSKRKKPQKSFNDPQEMISFNHDPDSIQQISMPMVGQTQENTQADIHSPGVNQSTRM